MGLEQYSDAELLKAAGVGEPTQPSMAGYSDEELLRAAAPDKPTRVPAQWGESKNFTPPPPRDTKISATPTFLQDMGNRAIDMAKDLYAKPAAVINTGLGFTTWTAPLAASLTSYLGDLLAHGDPGQAEAIAGVVSEEVQKWMPRLPNTEAGMREEEKIGKPLTWAKDLSRSIMGYIAPKLSAPGTTKAGKVVDFMADKIADFMSAGMVLKAGGMVAEGRFPSPPSGGGPSDLTPRQAETLSRAGERLYPRETAKQTFDNMGVAEQNAMADKVQQELQDLNLPIEEYKARFRKRMVEEYQNAQEKRWGDVWQQQHPEGPPVYEAPFHTGRGLTLREALGSYGKEETSREQSRMDYLKGTHDEAIDQAVQEGVASDAQRSREAAALAGVQPAPKVQPSPLTMPADTTGERTNAPFRGEQLGIGDTGPLLHEPFEGQRGAVTLRDIARMRTELGETDVNPKTGKITPARLPNAAKAQPGTSMLPEAPGARGKPETSPAPEPGGETPPIPTRTTLASEIGKMTDAEQAEIAALFGKGKGETPIPAAPKPTAGQAAKATAYHTGAAFKAGLDLLNKMGLDEKGVVSNKPLDPGRYTEIKATFHTMLDEVVKAGGSVMDFAKAVKANVGDWVWPHLERFLNEARAPKPAVGGAYLRDLRNRVEEAKGAAQEAAQSGKRELVSKAAAKYTSLQATLVKAEKTAAVMESRRAVGKATPATIAPEKTNQVASWRKEKADLENKLPGMKQEALNRQGQARLRAALEDREMTAEEKIEGLSPVKKAEDRVDSIKQELYRSGQKPTYTEYLQDRINDLTEKINSIKDRKSTSSAQASLIRGMERTQDVLLRKLDTALKASGERGAENEGAKKIKAQEGEWTEGGKTVPVRRENLPPHTKVGDIVNIKMGDESIRKGKVVGTDMYDNPLVQLKPRPRSERSAAMRDAMRKAGIEVPEGTPERPVAQRAKTGLISDHPNDKLTLRKAHKTIPDINRELEKSRQVRSPAGRRKAEELLAERSARSKAEVVKEKGKETPPTPSYDAVAEQLGIIFNGMQERPGGKEPIALFTDTKTKSTFGVEPGKTVAESLRNSRKVNGVKEGAVPETPEKPLPAIKDTATGKVWVGTSHMEALSKAGGEVKSTYRDGWAAPNGAEFVEKISLPTRGAGGRAYSAEEQAYMKAERERTNAKVAALRRGTPERIPTAKEPAPDLLKEINKLARKIKRETQPVEETLKEATKAGKVNIETDTDLMFQAFGTEERAPLPTPKARPIKETLKDAGTVLGASIKGERGSVSGKPLTDVEVVAALKRLKEDYARYSELAESEMKDMAEYLKENGFNPVQIKSLEAAAATPVANDPTPPKVVLPTNIESMTRDMKAPIAERGVPQTPYKYKPPKVEITTAPTKPTEPFARKTAETGVETQLRYMEEHNRIVPDYEKGSGVMPKRQEPIIPGTAPEASRDIRKSATYLSPSKTFGRVFGIMSHPVVDGFESLMSYVHNTKNMEKWTKDVLAPIKDSSKDVMAEIQKVVDKHQDTIDLANKLADDRKFLVKELRNVDKTSERYQGAIQKIAAVDKQIKVLAPKIQEMYGDHTLTNEALARQFSDVRVYLHAADELPRGILLDAVELKASQQLRGYMESTKGDLLKGGAPVLKGQAYMPRVWSALMGDEGLRNIAQQKAGLPAVLKFMSRTDNPNSWFPSAHGAMKSYVPTVEYKVAFQPFVNRWNRFASTTQRAVLGEYMQRWIQENVNRRIPNNMERILNGAVALEYTRLIGLSLSVGFKHVLKLVNTMSTFGAGTTAKATVQYGKVPVQALADKLGVKGAHNELRVVRSYVNMEQMVRQLDENPMLGKISAKTKAFLGNPVTAVEMMDNGISVLAGIAKGTGRGMSPETIHRAIWSTIFDCNFRSGFDQPLWQKSTINRMWSMFQMTPFKLAEFKLKVIRNMTEDVASMAKGQGGVKDTFGTHYSTIFMRYMMAVGAAEAIARSQGTSIVELFLHVPFVSDVFHGTKQSPYFQLGKIQAAESPVVQMIGRLHAKGLTPEGVTSAVAGQMTEFGPITKVRKAINDKYPKTYEGPNQYLLGLKKLEHNKPTHTLREVNRNLHTLKKTVWGR